MARAYVGIGSNVDPARQVRAALAKLSASFGSLQISPVYRSAAIGFEGADFYNLVVGFDTQEPPHAVDARLRTIEAEQGRRRTDDRYGPRTIDLDLLVFDDLIVAEQGLRLPREDVEKYAFVLRPLAEIAPNGRHPVTGQTYARMWEDFDASSQPLTEVALDL